MAIAAKCCLFVQIPSGIFFADKVSSNSGIPA